MHNLAASLTFLASDVKAGGVMKWGKLETGSEIEYFSISLDQASKLTFTNNKAYDSASSIAILDVNKEQLASVPYGWGEGSKWVVYLEPGEYEAKVGLAIDAIASCEAVPETVKESYTSRNDEKGTATKMELNQVYNGVRGLNDHVDFYSFTLNESSTVNVIFNSPAEYDEVMLLNKKGEFLYSSRRAIGTCMNSYVLPEGTYYLKMQDYTSNTELLGYAYKLQVKAKAVKQAQVKSVKSNQPKAVTITAKKQAGVVKYEFQIAKDKKFKKIVKKVSSKKNSVTVKKLSSKKQYYVRVRCQYSQAIRDDVRVEEVPVCKKAVTSYSTWSKVKAIKIK